MTKERDILTVFYAHNLKKFVEHCAGHNIDTTHHVDARGIPRFNSIATVDCFACWIAGAINEKAFPAPVEE